MTFLAILILAVCGVALIYFGLRAAGTALRFWRMGLAARATLAALFGAIYTLSPLDAVPDVLVGIGWLDDLIVLGVTAMYVWRIITQLQSSRRFSGANMRPAQRPTFIPQLPPR